MIRLLSGTPTLSLWPLSLSRSLAASQPPNESSRFRLVSITLLWEISVCCFSSVLTATSGLDPCRGTRRAGVA